MMVLVYRLKRGLTEKGVLTLLKRLLYLLGTIEFNKEIRHFNAVYEQQKWTEAIETAHNFNKKENNSLNILNKLAVCHFKIGDQEKANYYMRTGFQSEMKCSIVDIINDIETKIRNLFPSPCLIKSKYTYNGGKGNLGLIEHRCTLKNKEIEFITKLSLTTREDKKKFHKETFFYNEIRESRPQLKDITPRMIISGNISGTDLNFMTFAKVTGRHPDENDLKDVLEIDKVIKSVNTSEISKLFRKIVSENNISLTALLHKRSTNREIFSRMHKKVTDQDTDSELAALVSRLESVILGERLYDNVQPDIHYSFCHGDYNAGNFIISDSANYIIDWADYGIDFIDSDLAKYFIDFNFSFEEIEGAYLHLMNDHTPADVIRKVFFMYILVAAWVNHLNDQEIDWVVEKKIRPAVVYIENVIGVNEKDHQSLFC